MQFSGLFLPAVVRPILDSMESSKQVPPPALSDVSIECQNMFPFHMIILMSYTCKLFIYLLVYFSMWLFIPASIPWLNVDIYLFVVLICINLLINLQVVAGMTGKKQE